jgi:hypothetical protein
MHWRFLRTVKVPNDDNFTISPRAIDAAVGVGPLHPLTCAHPRWSGENPSVLHPMPPLHLLSDVSQMGGANGISSNEFPAPVGGASRKSRITI